MCSFTQFKSKQCLITFLLANIRLLFPMGLIGNKPRFAGGIKRDQGR